MLALVGRSGAGKTTLLRLVNRLLAARSRRASASRAARTREWDPIALRRRTGYVLQDVGLFPHLTIAENVGLVPQLARMAGRARSTTRVDELLAWSGSARRLSPAAGPTSSPVASVSESASRARSSPIRRSC